MQIVRHFTVLVYQLDNKQHSVKYIMFAMYYKHSQTEQVHSLELCCYAKELDKMWYLKKNIAPSRTAFLAIQALTIILHLYKSV